MANTPDTITSNPLSSQTFFNGYFSQPIQVSDAVWGQVYGYFLTLTKDASAASALAQSVIALTYNNNLDPLAVINEFSKAPNSSNVKTLLISFFNSSKGSTSKLGFKKLNETPPSVSRNIIA
jgi:hypothetical protein